LWKYIFIYLNIYFIIFFYYGGFLCVTWSPDNNYLLTGGEDDLISVWSFHEKKLVVRGRAHQSWVSRVVFDPWNCSEDSYTFASAGQDARLIIWEFCKSSIPKPRLKSAKRRDTPTDLQKEISPRGSSNGETTFPIIVPAFMSTDVGFLEPIAIHRASTEPLSDVQFTQDCIITTCWSGITKFWSRPAYAQKLVFPDDEEEEEQKENSEPTSKNQRKSEEEEELIKKTNREENRKKGNGKEENGNKERKENGNKEEENGNKERKENGKENGEDRQENGNKERKDKQENGEDKQENGNKERKDRQENGEDRQENGKE